MRLNTSCNWILLLLLTVCIGCPRSGSTATPRLNSPINVQMGDATLYVDGDRWLYAFNANGQPCVIVAVDVAFVEQTQHHLVLNMDVTESEKRIGASIDSHTLLNVPTNGHHPALVVTPNGFMEFPIAVPEKLQPAVFLRETMVHLQELNDSDKM